MRIGPTLRPLFFSLIFVVSKSYAFEFETNPEAQKIRQSQNFSLTTSASIGSNLVENSSADYSLYTDVALDPFISLDNGLTLLAHLSLAKDLRGEREEQLNDGYLGFSKGLYRQDAVSFSLLGLAFLPYSKESRENQYLDGGLMIAPTMAIDFSNYGAPGLRVSLRPSYRHNFHRYTTSKTGNSNLRQTYGLNLTLTYQLTGSIILISRNNYNRSITYRSNTRDAYRLEQAISYQFHPRASVTFGHLNGGSPLAPNGTDTEVKVFDNRSSQVYSSLSYTF